MTSAPEPAADHHALATSSFNTVWTLLERSDRTPADDDRMLHMAHASRFHWGEVGGPVNLVRGEWFCSRVYVVLGRSEPALHHAGRALALATEAGLSDWDLAFCHEGLARAHALAGDDVTAAAQAAAARAVPIAEDDDRASLQSDLATIALP